MPHKFTSRVIAVIALLCLGFVPSCKDDTPATPATQNHTDAKGMVIVYKGIDYVTVSGGTVTGAISLKTASKTDDMTVYFINSYGVRFQPSGSDVSLECTLGNTALAAFEQPPTTPWIISVLGLQVGATNAKFRLVHGDHADFESPDIALVVTSK